MSCLKGKRCEDTSVIDYELIDQDARVSASNDHEISPVGQAFGDIEQKNTVGVESICEVGVCIPDCPAL